MECPPGALGLVSLVGEKEGRVDLGGTILGNGEGSAGDGALGTFSFAVLPGFAATAGWRRGNTPR